MLVFQTHIDDDEGVVIIVMMKVSLNVKYLKSKMSIDEYGKDSSVENRDDNEVSRWEDLQRFLTNITIEMKLNSYYI